MKKHAYVIIPLLCFAGPLAMSFDRRVYFIQYLPAVLIAILSVGLLYIVWDVVVIRRGHWRFNDEFVGRGRLFHLPAGEWLFFLLIPYSCLFIFEVVAAYFGEGTARPDLAWLQYALSGVLYPSRPSSGAGRGTAPSPCSRWRFSFQPRASLPPGRSLPLAIFCRFFSPFSCF